MYIVCMLQYIVSTLYLYICLICFKVPSSALKSTWDDLSIVCFVCLFVCLFVCFLFCFLFCLLVSLSLKLFLCLFVCLFVSCFVSCFVCLFLCLLNCFFVCLFVCLCACFFVCFFVCLFVCLFGWLVGWLVGCFLLRLIEWLSDWLIYWFMDVLIYWCFDLIWLIWFDLIDLVCLFVWLIDCLFVWLIDCASQVAHMLHTTRLIIPIIINPYQFHPCLRCWIDLHVSARSQLRDCCCTQFCLVFPAFLYGMKWHKVLSRLSDQSGGTRSFHNLDEIFEDQGLAHFASEWIYSDQDPVFLGS